MSGFGGGVATRRPRFMSRYYRKWQSKTRQNCAGTTCYADLTTMAQRREGFDHEIHEISGSILHCRTRRFTSSRFELSLKGEPTYDIARFSSSRSAARHHAG